METLQRTANRGSVSTGVYEIDNSVKFEADNTERMYRPWGAGGGDDQTWTVSLWVKRTELGTLQHIWGAGVSGNDVLLLSFQTDDTLKFRSTKDAANDCVYVTNRVFRDTSAWYHIVTAVDTTSGTAGNRLRIYINGVEETSFSTETDFSQNDNTLHNANSSYMEIATAIGEADRFCGYIAEVISISGSQLAPTTFGETNSDTGIWIPIQYTGSFPQNSVFLEFKDSSSLGTDTSGNGQTFTLQNITALDQATDTPTNNFCTLNLQVPTYVNTGGAEEGGTFIDWGQNHYGAWFGTQGVKKGKWFWEFYVPSRSASYGLMNYIGLHTLESKQFASGNTYASSGSNVVFWLMHYGDYYATTNGTLTSQNTAAGLSSEGTGAIGRTFGVAFNADDAEITFYNNGSVTGNAGIDVYDIDESMAAGNFVFPFFQVYDNDLNVNFGGYSSVAISSGNSDANGYGNFEYAVPNGYYSLCTKNLAEFG